MSDSFLLHVFEPAMPYGRHRPPNTGTRNFFFYNVQQKATTVQTTSMKIWTYLIQCLLHALTDMLL